MAEEIDVQHEEPETETVRIQVVNPDEFVYSNVASVAVSQMDIRLTFAEALPEGKVTTKVGVVMSPEHASALALVLLQHLRVYEKQFGEIRLPQWKAIKKRFDRQAGEAPFTRP